MNTPINAYLCEILLDKRAPQIAWLPKQNTTKLRVKLAKINNVMGVPLKTTYRPFH